MTFTPSSDMFEELVVAMLALRLEEFASPSSKCSEEMMTTNGHIRRVPFNPLFGIITNNNATTQLYMSHNLNLSTFGVHKSKNQIKNYYWSCCVRAVEKEIVFIEEWNQTRTRNTYLLDDIYALLRHTILV